MSRQLWAAGRTDYVRRAMHVTDRGLAKGALAARARQTEDRIARAAETLTRLGTVTIAEVNARVVGPLDSTALRLLSSLLSRAWKSRVRRDGTRQAVSLDGALQITVLEPLLPQAARLIATSGTWTLPNYTICVELCEHVRTAERAAADLVGLSQDRTKRR